MARQIMSETDAFSDEIVQHFPTTFMRRRHRDTGELNKQLRRFLLDMEKSGRNKIAGTSNLGGFHSDTKLLNHDLPAIRELREMITQGIFAFVRPLIQAECSAPPENMKLTLWGWCTIMRQGDYNEQHLHPEANVSGTYYVATPEGMRNTKDDQPYGRISFVDPRPRADAMRLPNQVSAHAINPEPGDMVLFPSYYEHAVAPFKGPGVRICIAFNARID